MTNDSSAAVLVNISTTAKSLSNYDLFISAVQYIVFGSISVVTNLTIIFILLRNIKYFKKSALIAGLATGDLIYGFSLMVIGAERVIRYYAGTDSLTIRPFDCMKNLINPLLLVGNQIPGVMFLLIGIERFLAVYCYDWYYLKWSNKFAWTLTVIMYIYCTLSVSVAVLVTLSYDINYKIGIACGTANLVGPTYSAYNYGIGIVGGLVVGVATVVAMIKFTKRKSRLVGEGYTPMNVKTHVKKQWLLTRSTLCLAVADFAFLVMPSIIITLSSGFNVNFHVNLTQLKVWALQLVCFRSILNIIIYLLLNSEFRSAASHAVCCCKNIVGSKFFENSVNPADMVLS